MSENRADNKISRIREILNLSTNADSTNSIFFACFGKGRIGGGAEGRGWEGGTEGGGPSPS